MEENSSITSRLEHGWQIRLLLAIIFFGLLFTSAYSNLIVSTYAAKMLVCTSSLCAIGFMMGFRSHSEDKQTRRAFFFAGIVIPCSMLIQISGELLRIRKHPADDRYPMLLSQPFLCTFLVLITALVSSFFIGKEVFRRLYPDRAILRLTDEERKDLAPPPPEVRAAFRRYALGMALIMVPSLVSMMLLPKYSIKILLVSACLMCCFMSFIIGMRWNSVKHSFRWGYFVMGIIVPILGFVSYYSASKSQDVIHLVRALKFSGSVLAAMWIPLLAARLMSRLRR